MHGLGCKLSSATVIYLHDFRVVGFNEAFPLCIFSYEVQHITEILHYPPLPLKYLKANMSRLQMY